MQLPIDCKEVISTYLSDRDEWKYMTRNYDNYFSILGRPVFMYSDCDGGKNILADATHSLYLKPLLFDLRQRQLERENCYHSN